MNKTELVAAVAERAELSRKDADAAICALVETITDALKDGDKVQLVGFGTFEVKNRAARVATKPGTTEKINIPAAKVPSFKAGKALKDTVNQ